MRRFALVTLFALIATAAAVSVFAATHYISPGGDDIFGDGSADYPFYSLNTPANWNMVNPGDTVAVLPGSYTYTSTLNFNGGWGTAGNPVTYKGLGAVDITLTNSSSWGLMFWGGHDVKLDGLSVSGAYATVYFSDGARNELANCTLKNAAWCQLVIANSPGSFIHNSVFTGTGTGFSTSWAATGNKFYNNTFAALTGWAATFWATSGQSDAGQEFKNNIMQGCGSGIYDGTTAGVAHDFNMMYGMGEAGWYGGSATKAANETTTIDPMLVDYAGGDYHLAWNSPAINGGTLLGLPYSGSAPDLGAFETPEPGSLAVLAFGALGLGGLRIRRRR